MAARSVDEYINQLDGWKVDAARQLRVIVIQAAPQAEERFKWAQPVYELNGPFCYFKAFKNTINFGFWRGVELDDPRKLLQGEGGKMRHVKITSPDDIDASALSDFVHQAVSINQRRGDPTKGN